MLIFHKVHGSSENSVLAVCDRQLCGKTIKSGKIEFDVSEGFYKGEEITEEKLREILPCFENINIVGNKAVGIAIEEGIVSQEAVLEIAKVKHVQIFKI